MLNRLFAEYPSERITVLSGSSYSRHLSPCERKGYEHIIFPSLNNTGPWGLGRIKLLINYLFLPALCFAGAYLSIKMRAGIIVTVAHGHFFLAASLISRFLRIPMVLLVHDFWPDFESRGEPFFKQVYGLFFYFALKCASRVYSISQGMQSFLKERYKVESFIQMPSCEERALVKEDCLARGKNAFRIIYAGNLDVAASEGVEFLIKSLKSDFLSHKFRVPHWELVICSKHSTADLKMVLDEDESIIIKRWLNQQELAKELRGADILFLPFFSSRIQQRVICTSLPTKISDYLSSGKPILILSPSYSSLARYAKMQDFAEIVCELDSESLLKAVYTIFSDEERRNTLCENALITFKRNHLLSSQRNDFEEALSSLARKWQKN